MNEYRAKNKAKVALSMKEYKYKNKQNISEKQRLYDISNKEKIASRDAEKIFCESCELYHRRGDKSKHYKTQNHLANLAIFTDK